MDENTTNYHICYLDFEGVFLEVTDEFANLLQVRKDQLIGKHIRSFLPSEYSSLYRESFYNTSISDQYFLFSFKRKDGVEVFIYTKSRTDIHNGRKVIKAYVQQIDTIETSFKLTHKLLAYEGLIRDITEVSSVATNTDDFVTEVLTLFGRTLDVDHTFLYRYDKTGNILKLHNSWFNTSSDLVAEGNDFQFDAIDSFKNKLENGTTHFCPDTFELENKSARANFKEIGIRAYINEPVFIHGRFYGFFGYNMKNTNRERMIDDLALVKSIGRIITQTTERLLVIEKLQQREFFNRIQIEQSDIGMAIIDVKKRHILESNKKFLSIIGYTLDEFYEMDWRTKSTPEEVEQEEKLNTSLYNHEIDSYSLNKSWIKSDGSTIYITVRKSIYWNDQDEDLYIILSFEDTTERTLAIEEIEHLNNHDDLTGIYNRRYFESYIKKIDNKEFYPLSIVIIDLNGLKLINDAFGHKAGDTMLQKTAELLNKYVQEIGVLSRIGGDEFAILLPNTKSEYTYELFNKIEKGCESIFVSSVQLSLAYGVYERTSNIVPFYEEFKIAEDEMYRMKLIDVPSMRTNAIETILNTLFEKDEYSKAHSSNVSLLTSRLANKMGFNVNQISNMKMAGLLHDIGKIIVQDQILKKVGKLDNYEYLEIQKHSEIGYRILCSTKDFRKVADYVLSHHEFYDGYGYPHGLKGEEIPIESRIIGVVDAFDAMISYRSYRKNMTIEEAKEELKRCSGTQFDPSVVRVFLEHADEIIKDIYTK